MADPIKALARIVVPQGAYGGGSAPLSLPASAVLLFVSQSFSITDYVYYEYSVGDDVMIDKFVSVTGIDQGVTTSPAKLPIPLGIIAIGTVRVVWEVFPHT